MDIATRTAWKLNHRIGRLAGKIGAGIATEKQSAGFRGALAARRNWYKLDDIRAEIAPQIQALRQRQEILESIGTRVNGGF